MRHPKGLYLLFTVEMWERFSYYGMRAILIFYLTKTYLEGGLGFDLRTANLIYGVFTGLVYFTPVIGGWIADRYLGQRNSIVIGALLMAAGESSLAAGQDRGLLLSGLSLLTIGNGFFKPNISVIVGKLYSHDDHRRDAAFTIFYMGINVGALFSPLICGTLSENYNYNIGFLAAGIGLLIGLLLYLLLQRPLLGNAGVRQTSIQAHAMPPLEQVQSMRPSETPTSTTHDALTQVERDRTWVIIIVTCFAVFFFASFEQAGSSLNIFTDRFVDRTVGSFTIPAAWFQSVNPIFIVVLAPLFSMLWQWLGQRKKEPSIPVKMSLGMILVGVGFLFMVGAVLESGNEDSGFVAKASMSWIILTYLFNTLGELCLSPIGLSMVSTLAPVKYASLLMGIWLMSSFVANILAGFIAAAVQQVGPLTIFASIAIVCILCGVTLLALSSKLRRMMHQD